MDNYDDIINLPHHEPRHHPRMSMWNRAAQFAPFAALTGFDAAIQETDRLTLTTSEPTMPATTSTSSAANSRKEPGSDATT
jgi:hypothetical protein